MKFVKTRENFGKSFRDVTARFPCAAIAVAMLKKCPERLYNLFQRVVDRQIEISRHRSSSRRETSEAQSGLRCYPTGERRFRRSIRCPARAFLRAISRTRSVGKALIERFDRVI